jgi:hypothetical protein
MDAVLPTPALVFESDLAPDRVGVGGGASPVAVGLGCSLEPLDDEVLGTGPSRTSISPRSGGVEALTGALEFARIEWRGVVEDALLAGVEVGELLVGEVTKAACEVAVGLKTCVIPGGARVGS